MAAASSMSTSTAPRTVLAMCSHRSLFASLTPAAAPLSFSLNAIGRSILPGSTAPSSPRHTAASRCTRSDSAVLFSETQHRSSAATSLPTTSAALSLCECALPCCVPVDTRLVSNPDDGSSCVPFKSFETSAGSTRSARRNSPSAVARTACDSSSRPSVRVCSSDTNGISPRSSLTAALASARRSQLGSVGNRASNPHMISFPERNTSSSMTSAAAAALTNAALGLAGSSSSFKRTSRSACCIAETLAPLGLSNPLPGRPTRLSADPSGRCGSIATTTRPATARK
mmetsp:Transcript_551/g.2146  ORF Transcript_551/g.2146 Transcript_551/m.2146 type:complete len:285 (-) Transcript_551:1195-2049(-)